MSRTAEIVNINGGKPMPSKNGFVMAWRDMKKQPWYKNPECVAVFTHIMLSATSKPTTYNRKGAVCKLRPGDFVTTYDELGEQFGLGKSKVRRIIDTFLKHGQIKKSLISTNKINKGFVVSLTGWNKWQNTIEKTDTWSDTRTDTQADTSKVTNIKALSTHSDTQPDTLPDTQADTVLNNKVLNNKKIYAGSETQHAHLELRSKAFEHFWTEWTKAKRLIGQQHNPAPKNKTREKFMSVMTGPLVSKLGEVAFKAEVSAMCKLFIKAHKDIARVQGSNEESDYFAYERMYPQKFLSNKAWRDS